MSVTPSVQISLARMKRILEIDLRNRCALVEAGVTNTALSEAVADSPYHYAPDPSSQRASTIGGNIATNAGGLHTLKYGVTVNHILGVEVVLEDGIAFTPGAGGRRRAHDGAGSCRAFLRDGGDAGDHHQGVVPAGSPGRWRFARGWRFLSDGDKASAGRAVPVPDGGGHYRGGDRSLGGALEMMDGTMIGIVEDAFHLGFPKTAQALLLIEVDGQDAGLDEDLRQIEEICRKNGCCDFLGGRDPQRRAELWSGRKRAFGAIGRITPSYCTQDACVPRSKLPEVIERIAEICGKYKLRITNVFHAGDGNVHPVLMYDEADEAFGEAGRLEASAEILRYCVSIGGSVTGEHGVGIEKLPYLRDMFSKPWDLAAMHRIRGAFVSSDTMNCIRQCRARGLTLICCTRCAVGAALSMARFRGENVQAMTDEVPVARNPQTACHG